MRLRCISYGSLLVGLGLWGLSACSGTPPLARDNPYQPYDTGAVVTVDDERTSVIETTTVPCDPAIGPCTETKREGHYCTGQDKDGAADIIKEGNRVVAVVCYGTAASHEKNVTATSSWDGKLDANNSLVTFGEGSQTYSTGLKVNGNRVTIYGNGPDKTIFQGDSETSGNNTRVRGVSIRGNLSMNGNNASLVLTTIVGNLTINGNNALLANVIVYGDLTLGGNNAIFRRVFVEGKVQLSGKNYVCSSTRYFTDPNKDRVVEDTELGEAWTCPAN